MDRVNSLRSAEAVDSIDIEVRVRYHECDPMNVAHHAVYPVWLEMARIEMLRRCGQAYRELEAQGTHFVVARMYMRYHRPANNDDVLRIHAETMPAAGIKVDHLYAVYRGDELVAEAQTTLVCVDRNGRPQRIPQGTIG